MELRKALTGFLVLAAFSLASAQTAQTTHVIPSGTDIKVRTDTAVPAKPAANSKYTGTVSNDVMDNTGAVAIPRGSHAQLVAVPTPDGKDTNLDLRAVTVNGQRQLLTMQSKPESSRPGGLGANARTGKYVGGGAAVGAVLGALMGGGKGAAIGALLGGAGGAGAQVYTGKKKEIPPETELSFKTANDLQMRPSASHSKTGTQRTPTQ
jgi:hypothetical protein